MSEPDPIRVLIVGDDPAVTKQLNDLLLSQPSSRYRCDTVSRAEPKDRLSMNGEDVALVVVPESSRRMAAAVRELADAFPEVAVLVLVAGDCEWEPSDVVLAGAQDCLSLDGLEAHVLSHAIQYALAHKRLDAARGHPRHAAAAAAEHLRVAGENSPISIFWLDGRLGVAWQLNPPPWLAEHEREDRETDPVASQPELASFAQEVLASGTRQRRDVRLRVGDDFRVYDMIAEPIHDALGEAEGLMVVAIDITERSRADLALRASEQKYRLLVDRARDGILLFDAEGRVLEVNDRFSEMSGFSRSELLGMSMADLLAPQEAQNGALAQVPSFRSEPQGTERLLRRSDRTTLAVDIAETLLPDGGTEWIVRDISARKRAEAARFESEGRFQMILENAPIGMALVGIDGRWLLVNRALCRMLGYTEEELLERTFQELTHPEDLSIGLDAIQQLMEGRTNVYQLEKRYLHKKGHAVWVQLTATLLRDRSERPLYSVKQIQNITERRHASELTTFLGEAAQVLASSLNYEETLRTVARLAVPRLADLCVIDLREDDAMRTVEAVAADPVKQGVLSELCALYPSDTSSLVHPVGRVMLTGRSTFWSRVRQDVLAQIAHDDRQLALLHLLAPVSIMILPLPARGRILGTVTLFTSESGRHYGPVDLAAAEDLARTAALAIDNAHLFHQVQQSALGDNGTVDFDPHDPRPQNGLRTRRPSHANGEASSSGLGHGAGAGRGKRNSEEGERSVTRVLLVDDNPQLRVETADFLDRQGGIEVVGEAESGEDAVQMARFLAPDVVLMKLSVAGIGGLEATRRITRLKMDTHVLLVCEPGQPPGVEARDAGAAGCLDADSSPTELAAAIRAVMRGEELSGADALDLPPPQSAARNRPASPDPLQQLTQQERSVIALAATGLTAARIAKRLFLSERTVETYRSRAMRKLGLENRADLVAFALRTGLLKEKVGE